MNFSVIKSLFWAVGLCLYISPATADVTKTVGSSDADYATLKAAFDAINSGAINTGVITLQIIDNTTETTSAVIYQSGYGGTSSYTAIHIYPTVTGKTITGNLAEALIDFNGADSVTIDGRLNATGSAKDLIINNTSILATAGTSTIRFLNDATNNIVKYGILKGSSTDAAAGILFFSTSTATGGNDGNLIDNNSISNSADANRPINAIYSAGTVAKENDGNTVSNNYLYDFLNKGTASNGIQLTDNNTAWAITGNSFYETASFAPSASVEYSGIRINSPSGISFTVSNNYIGGSAASCAGTWIKTNAFNNIFSGIYLNAGSTDSSIQNNVINNFTYANSTNANWTGIHVAGGTVNLGTVTGNTVGASTGTGSITVTNSTTGGIVYGINISGINDANCQNNNIGSMTAANSNAANATNLYGIFKAATAGTTIFNNNMVGSISTSNSLQTTSNADANPQWLCGIYSAGIGSTTISGNTIVNMLNASTNSASNVSTPMLNISCLRGILTVAGNNTIQNNIVHHLSTAITSPDNYEDASLIGIAQIGITSASMYIISGNTVYNLTNTASTKIEMYGIQSKGAADGSSTIYKNFVYSFFLPSATTGSYLHGISLYAGVSIVSNNIVLLGDAISIGCFLFGIWKGSNNSMSIYHNTVYFNGTVTSTGNSGSFTFRDLSSAPDARNIRNNLFVNARSNSPSTTSGKNYTIYLASTGYLTLDYNNYWVSGVGGVLGSSGGDKTTLPIVAGQNAHSLNMDPLFMSAGTVIPTSYKIKQQLQGATDLLPAFPDDYGRINYRVTPTMGAWEQKNYWMGYTDTAWSKAKNWTEGFVPLTGQNIIYCTVANYGTVAANDLLVDADYTIGSLTNATEKKLVIPTTKSLTVNSNIVTDGNPDRIYIQSDVSAANGSLIFPNASNVYGSVEMFSKAAYNPGGLVNNKYKWQFFGIPITTLKASPTFDGSWVRIYDETGTTISNHWIALTNTSDLTPLTGYEITQVSARTILFQGNLVNAGFTRTLAFTISDPEALYPGQHIFGNPYTAAINIKQLIFGAQTEASVYLYNTGSFQDWTTNDGKNVPGENPGQYTVAPKATAGEGGIPAQIPSMQGFLVKAMSNSIDATFQIPYNAVAVKNTDLQRAPSARVAGSPDKVYTIVDVKGSRFSDRMWIFTDPSCTRNFDNGWDGYKMIGSSFTPQLFAMEEDGYYQVNSVDDMNDTYLGFQTGEDSMYTLTFTHKNLEKHYAELYLLDLDKNGITDIFQSGTNYSFTALHTQTPAKRFKIIASRSSDIGTRNDLSPQTGIKIICTQHMIIVRNFSNLDGILFLYDFSGRIIQKNPFTALGVSKLPTAIPPGYYLVKAKTDSLEVIEQLVIR